MKTVYGKLAYEGFAKAIGGTLGLKVRVDDGASACIDVNGTISLPGMSNYQTADEFAATCGTLVHELSHQFYKSHGLIDPKRSKLEHACLNTVLDVADETWVDKYFQIFGNVRPGELLAISGASAWSKNFNNYVDWTNTSTHAWKVLCLGIFAARLPSIRSLRRALNWTARKVAPMGVDAKLVWKLIKKAKLGKSQHPAPTPARFRKLLVLAKQLAALLAPFAPADNDSGCGNGDPCDGDTNGTAGESLTTALGKGKSTKASDEVEASESEGAGTAKTPAPGAGSGVAGTSSSNGNGTRFDSHAFTSLYPAVQRVAQRIALDGDGLNKNDGLSNGPSMGQAYRLLTDGQCLSRWNVSDMAEGVAVAVLLDCSGSMCGVLPQCAGIARAFVEGLKECGNVESIAFGCSAKRVESFDRVSDMGSTNTTAALRLANDWLATQSAGSKWVVIITDGEPNDMASAVTAVSEIKTKGGRVLAVGLDCEFTMAGATCTWAKDTTRLAIALDTATRRIEASRE